jgi:hypothetical protein
MPSSWRTAYFKQAMADYALFKRLLIAHDIPICQRLHYLQMTTEKLAKGFLTSKEGDPPERTHYAFANFIQLIKRTPALRRICDCKEIQVRPYLDSLLPIATEIEELAPIGNRDKPNPEYPWEIRGTVTAPVEYDFKQLDLKSPRMLKMLRLIENCFVYIEEELQP